MSAGIVQDVYMKFSEPGQPFWQRMIDKNGKNCGDEQIKKRNWLTPKRRNTDHEPNATI